MGPPREPLCDPSKDCAEGDHAVALSQFDLSEALDALCAGGHVDLMRSSVEMVLQALIVAEATEVIGAGPGGVARLRTFRSSSHGERRVAGVCRVIHGTGGAQPCSRTSASELTDTEAVAFAHANHGGLRRRGQRTPRRSYPMSAPTRAARCATTRTPTRLDCPCHRASFDLHGDVVTHQL
jgi:hypothetical protein